MKPIGHLVLIALFCSGCTKLAPEIGFGALDSTKESLTLETNLRYINASTASSTLKLKGICESNTNLVLVANETSKFKCDNLTFSKDIPASSFADGQHLISIEAFDDSENKIAGKDLVIIKDTVLPTATISGPSVISSIVSKIALSGSCSENDLNVKISETVFGSEGFAKCENNLWTYEYDSTANILASEYQFYATHSDLVVNEVRTDTLVVNRMALGDFTIAGVRADVTDNYSNLLKRVDGDVHISWSSSTGAAEYDVVLEKIIAGSPSFLCKSLSLQQSSVTFNIASACPMGLAEQIRITVKAWDPTHVYNASKSFDFYTKAAPSLKDGASTLYINSDLTQTPATTEIPYSYLINDPHSTGPFNVTIESAGGLGSQVVVDNAADPQVLKISPAAKVTGVFDIQVKIKDEFGNTSNALPMKIVIVLPFSWTGSVSNDFNDKGNWCGIASVKDGCPGQTDSPNLDSEIVIDNLCDLPVPEPVAIHCSPSLSQNTTVRSFLMKDKNFLQNTHSLTVGTNSDSNSYFHQLGGTFNDATSTGDLTFFRSFLIEGGIFNAPMGSNVFLNTRMSVANSESFKVVNKDFYNHNGSTLHLLNSQGGSQVQVISVPTDFRLNSMTINSVGGKWALKTENLVLDGDINLKGVKDSNDNRPYLIKHSADSKITLNGNLNCEGNFAGGNLPITVLSPAATYKSNFEGCKFPPIRIEDSSASLTENPASSNNIILQSLNIIDGTFDAPTMPNKLIFSPVGLENDSIIADIQTGFAHNGGTIEFQVSDNSKNYKLRLPALYDVDFTNLDGRSAFYELLNNFSAVNLRLLGPNSIPLRGSAQTMSFNSIILETGIVPDTARLNKFLLKAAGTSPINVLTSAPLNIRYFDIRRSTTLVGSDLFDFSGTTFVLGVNNIIVPEDTTLNYFDKTGTGSITGAGTINSGK